jgi:type I restriction enzyme S subunit
MTASQLKNAILQYAVQGKLVPQNPNDEPASVLLEKIGKERKALIKAGKIKSEKPFLPITDEEIPFEIPKSWEWVRLGEIVTIIMGQSPDGNSVGTNVNGIEFHQGKSFFSDYIINTSEIKTSKPSKIVPQNCVLLCVRAPVGKVNITNREICIGRGLCGIIPLGSIPLNFLFYTLLSFENEFVKQSTGTTFKAIQGDVISNQLFPLPPFDEQRRIVERIEELLPLVDEYNKAEQILSTLYNEFPEKLKKSILQSAIQGKLVPQDSNDEPASVLLERVRTEKKKLIKEGKIKPNKEESIIFRRDNSHYEKRGKTERCIDDEIPFEIPESWAWCTVDTIGEIITGSTPSTAISDYYGNDYPFFKPTDLDVGKNIISSREMLSTKGFNISRKLKPNSILVTCIGATIGKTGLINITGTCNQQINAIIPNTSILADYLYYCCISDFFQKNIKLNASSTTLPILNKNKFSRLYLPLPPFGEQKRIVDKIEKLLLDI